VIDLREQLPDAERQQVAEGLDHPGGFDYAAPGEFWIPVARSDARGPSVILRVGVDRQPESGRPQPLAEGNVAIVMTVDDHIGALCHEPATGRWYGANWDTLLVYEWQSDGRLVARIPRDEFVQGLPGWRLAIQDWKAVGDGTLFDSPFLILAGGLDKSPDVAAGELAVIELLAPVHRTRLARLVLPAEPGATRPLTNEGLAVHNRHLYLLPDDIGAGAEVWQLSLQLAGPAGD
jgi:hypothetical protein